MPQRVRFSSNSEWRERTDIVSTLWFLKSFFPASKEHPLTSCVYTKDHRNWSYLSILLHQAYMSESHHVLAHAWFNQMITNDCTTVVKAAVFQHWKSPAPQLGHTDRPLPVPHPLWSRTGSVWQCTEKGTRKKLESPGISFWVTTGKRRKEHCWCCIWVIPFLHVWGLNSFEQGGSR